MQRGFLNEFQIIDELNEKRFKDLTPFWRDVLLKPVFRSIPVCDEDVLESYKCDINGKPDIAIRLNGITKYISVKSGERNTVHQESLKTFIEFLKQNDISDNTIETLLLFHYGDGTTDGTGEVRFNTRALLSSLSDRLKIANNELNCNRMFISKCIRRFIFDGVDNTKVPAEFLYHGDKDSGYLVTEKDLIKFALWLPMDWMFMPHIGPMTITPYLRDVEKISKNQYKRDIVNISWRDLRRHLVLIKRFEKEDNELKKRGYLYKPQTKE